MKELTMNTQGRSGLTSKPSFIDDWARRSVFAALKNLRGGQLTLEDGTGTYTLGDQGDLSASVRILHPDFYRRLAFGGSLGAAESFMDGEWTTDDLSATLRIFARDLASSENVEGGWARLRNIGERSFHWMKRNTVRGSSSNIHAHYDLGNPLFRLFLDDTLSYSAGVFEHKGASLKDASLAKMDRACRKLELRPADHLLEIGTGWGGMAIHAASHYGCQVTTTTISEEQYVLARERVAAAGLQSRIRVLKEDYRELTGTYDKLVSIEMIEAVGHGFLDTYFRQCCSRLKRDGLMFLQAIVTPDYRYDESRKSVDFIRRYIFPGSCLTSMGAISASLARATDMRITHVEDIGPHYAETLRQWRVNFLNNIDAVRRLGYDEHFLRMWDYYLCYSEAGFEERIVGDVQIVLERPSSRRASILGALPSPEVRAQGAHG